MGRHLAWACAVIVAVAGPVVPSDSTAQSRHQFPGWNVEYELPWGWYVRQAPGRLHVLGSDSEPGAIFVAPGLYTNIEDVNADLEVLARLGRLVGQSVEGPADTVIDGMPGAVATYTAQGQSGQPVRAHLLAVFSPHGTGVILFGMATPTQLHNVRGTLERMASTVKAAPPDIDDASVSALVGRWANYRRGRPPTSEEAQRGTQGVDDLYEFDGAGAYEWKSAVYLAAEARDRADDPSLIGVEYDRGTYTVLDGSLVLKGPGGQRLVPFDLQGDRLVVGERTYFKMPAARQ